MPKFTSEEAAKIFYKMGKLQLGLVAFKLYDALKSIEWAGAYHSLCPCCNERKPENGWYGHAPDCQLAAALRKAEGK